MDNGDVKLLKDIEQSKKGEKEFNERQEKNKQFEEASQGAYFTLFNSVIGAVTAVVSVIVIEILLWRTSKVLFTIVTLLLLISVVLRQVSKYYFMKGKQKKFETFNKLSKATGVVSSVADATVLKGSKGVDSTDKAASAQDKISGVLTTLAEMQFNGGVYVDPKYDSVRERCVKMGKYIFSTQNSSYLTELLSEIYKETESARMTKMAGVSTKLFVLYIKDHLTHTYVDYNEDLFYAMLGALYYYRSPMKDLPNSVPFIGYKDNVFCVFCVYAGNKEAVDKYSDWKLCSMRNKAVEKYANNIPAMWEFLCSKGEQFDGDFDKLLSDYNDELDKGEIHTSHVDTARSYGKLVKCYRNGLYTEVSQEEVNGVTGFICQVASGKPLAVDGLTDEGGYLDNDVLLSCCQKTYPNLLDTYKVWENLYNIYEESDPLTEYLNMVIGSDKSSREREIKRLAKGCTDKSLHTDEERARWSLSRQLNLPQPEEKVPDDLKDWADKKGLSEDAALQLIYSYIPEAVKTQGSDVRHLSLKYWKEYKSVIIGG